MKTSSNLVWHVLKVQKESLSLFSYSGALVEVQQFMRLGPDDREAYLSKKRSEALKYGAR